MKERGEARIGKEPESARHTHTHSRTKHSKNKTLKRSLFFAKQACILGVFIVVHDKHLFHLTGLKGRASALRKLKTDYAGDASRLKDLVRFTASFPNCGRMKQFVDSLRAQPGVKVLALKNKYSSPTPLGYRDVNLTLQVQLASGRPHVCELQVNLDDMLVAKELAHVLYEQVSLLQI